MAASSDELPHCQTPVPEAPFTASTAYREEKEKVCKIVASAPEGLTLGELLNRLHGRDGWESGGAAYQRTRRFVSSHPEYFSVRDASSHIWVDPQLSLLDLINGGITPNTTEKPQHTGREFCEDVLKSVKEVNDRGQELLERNLSEYLERINDLRLVLQAQDPNESPEYITLPYKTRFNDEGRINKQWSIMSRSLELAGGEWENAALLTLTTDPKKFDSLHGMWTSINESWNRFMSWVSTDSRLGYRPEYVKVLEATEKGYPHIHAIVFLEEDSTRYDGMPWLEDKQAISEYWAKYQGEVVDVQPLTYVRDLGDGYEAEEGWVRWDSDGDHGGNLGREASDGGGQGQTAGAYLGKYLSAIYGGIRDANAKDVEVMTDGGQPLEDEEGGKYEDKAATWKVAMYWATRRKIRTNSLELRGMVEEAMEEEEGEDLEAALFGEIAARDYEFVGAWGYGDLPDHIRRETVDAEALIRPLEEPDPPPGAGDDIPKSREDLLKMRYPASAWDLLEGLLGLEGDRR